MTPSARYAAAIDVLDQAAQGQPAEKVLTAWGRSNRYAGSKDRASVRDHVYDVLRQKRSLAHLGGGETGRHLVLGLLRSQGIDPADIFGAGGYGPAALTDIEAGEVAEPMPDAVAHDLPDWLWPIWASDLDNNAKSAALVQQSRAPVALRVNLRRGTVAEAQSALAQDEILTQFAGAAKTGLLVTKNARRIRQSKAFLDGLVELQDVSSQQAVAGLKISDGARVLDYCAGGGGKALAIADMHNANLTAHDIAPERTVDIAPRALRAGVAIDVIATSDLGQQPAFDLVFCDAPCSGSGTWRRTPESKWTLNADKLHKFSILQGQVITNAASFVTSGGTLVYATCSVLTAENGAVIDAFVGSHAGWSCVSKNQRMPDFEGDGFFHAVLLKN